MGLSPTDDPVDNEIRLSRVLDYEPMFMTACTGLIFPWKEDDSRSDDEWIVSVISTPDGEWTKRISRRYGDWGDDSGFPVRTEADYDTLVQVCEQIRDRKPDLQAHFRQWRQRVGENGVLVLGHPHISWQGYQVGQRNLIYHYHDYPKAFRRGMEAVYHAARYVFTIAMEEGIDFMSESTYGLEMTSWKGFDEVDLPYLRALSDWTHERDGLFWYHNCGHTRQMILSGRFNLFEADVIETLAPPAEGDNDLAESRRFLDTSICTKGNLSLHTLRDGSVDDVRRETE